MSYKIYKPNVINEFKFPIGDAIFHIGSGNLNNKADYWKIVGIFSIKKGVLWTKGIVHYDMSGYIAIPPNKCIYWLKDGYYYYLKKVSTIEEYDFVAKEKIE